MDVVKKILDNGAILMMFSDGFDRFAGELVFRIKVVKRNNSVLPARQKADGQQNLLWPKSPANFKGEQDVSTNASASVANKSFLEGQIIVDLTLNDT
jgi:hypothetical protein